MSQKHSLIIMSTKCGTQLHVYSLDDGSWVCSIGWHGTGKGQFRFWYGGLCITPGGESVLVAEHDNDRVQEVGVLETEDTSRFIRGLLGKGPAFGRSLWIVTTR